MLIRLNTSLCWAGTWHHSEDVVDLPEDLARRYIAAGSAEPISEPPVETAALHTTPPKGKRDVRYTATRT